MIFVELIVKIPMFFTPPNSPLPCLRFGINIRCRPFSGMTPLQEKRLQIR